MAEPAEGGEPACYMTSGEEVFWSEPRACYRLGVARGPDPERALLVLRIDPPAIGQAFGLGGEDIDTVVVTPVTRLESVDPLTLPVEVHVLLPRERWREGTEELGRDGLRHVARARLVATRSEAEAKDQSMQRMHGPRR